MPATKMNSPGSLVVQTNTPQTDSSIQSDADLLARFCNSGDEASFRALVERYSTMVSSVCSAVLRNRADVEDAFQATFFVLARKAAKITQRENIGAWLHRVALRCALTLRRRTVNRTTVELPEDDQFADQELAKVSTRAMISALHEQLDRLPEKSRIAMIAVYLEGLDQKAAAEKLGINQAAVQKRLERGRAMLRRRLGMLGFAGIALSCLCNKAMGSSLGIVSHTVFSSTVSIAMQVRLTWAKGSVVIAGERASLSLAQGVLKSMMFTSAIQSAAAVVVSASIGLAAFSAATLAQDQQPQEQPGTQAATLHDSSANAEEGPPNPGVQVAQQNSNSPQPTENPSSLIPVPDSSLLPQETPSSVASSASSFPLPQETANSVVPSGSSFPLPVANQREAPRQSNPSVLPSNSPTAESFPFPTSQQPAPSNQRANQNRQPSVDAFMSYADRFVERREDSAALRDLWRERHAEVQASKEMLEQRVADLERQLALYERLQQLESDLETLRAENADLRKQLRNATESSLPPSDR